MIAIAQSLLGDAAKIDLFQERVCQAWARIADGRTYFFTPQNSTALATSTWTMYEFPELTRNPVVTEIFTIDPRILDGPGRRVIWRAGDLPTANAPGTPG